MTMSTWGSITMMSIMQIMGKHEQNSVNDDVGNVCLKITLNSSPSSGKTRIVIGIVTSTSKKAKVTN